MSLKILFLGQMRTWENFLSQIKFFQSQNVIEVDIYYHVEQNTLTQSQFNMLNDMSIRVIVSDPISRDEVKKFDPKLDSRNSGIRKVSGGMANGSLWKQIIDLNTAYSHFEDDDYILRTRADLVFNESIFTDLVSYINTGKLEEKIWVQWINVFEIFYIHDTAFMGKLKNLRKYIDIDSNISLAKFYPLNSLPVFFWIKPWINNDWCQNFILKWGLKKPHILYLLNSEYRNAILNYLVEVQKSFIINYGQIGWFLQWDLNVEKKRIWKNYISNNSFLRNVITRRFFVENNKDLKKIIKILAKWK